MYIKNMYILNNRLLLVLIFILSLFLIIINRNNNELFTDYFIDTIESKNIMSNKKYFSFFNKSDFKLRNCKNKKDCIDNYYNNTIEFTEEEKKNKEICE